MAMAEQRSGAMRICANANVISLRFQFVLFICFVTNGITKIKSKLPSALAATRQKKIILRIRLAHIFSAHVACAIYTRL